MPIKFSLLSSEKEQTPWIFLGPFLGSIVFHGMIGFFIVNLSQTRPVDLSALGKNLSKSTIHLLPKNPPFQNPPKPFQPPQNTKQSHSKAPPLLSQKTKPQKMFPPTDPAHQDVKNPNLLPKAPQSYSDFLPRLSEEQNDIPQNGRDDIPSPGERPAPGQSQRTQPRRQTRDLGLFPFSQEFRSRFSAVWNAEPRILSKLSSLKPGDLVFYQIEIDDQGKFLKMDNLTKKEKPSVEYREIDGMVSQTLGRVLPIGLPPKYRNTGVVIRETIAIQVVDGWSPKIHFDF